MRRRAGYLLTLLLLGVGLVLVIHATQTTFQAPRPDPTASTSYSVVKSDESHVSFAVPETLTLFSDVPVTTSSVEIYVENSWQGFLTNSATSATRYHAGAWYSLSPFAPVPQNWKIDIALAGAVGSLLIFLAYRVFAELHHAKDTVSIFNLRDPSFLPRLTPARTRGYVSFLNYPIPSRPFIFSLTASYWLIAPWALFMSLLLTQTFQSTAPPTARVPIFVLAAIFFFIVLSISSTSVLLLALYFRLLWTRTPVAELPAYLVSSPIRPRRVNRYLNAKKLDALTLTTLGEEFEGNLESLVSLVVDMGPADHAWHSTRLTLRQHFEPWITPSKKFWHDYEVSARLVRVIRPLARILGR